MADRRVGYRTIHIGFCGDNLKAKEALSAALRAVEHTIRCRARGWVEPELLGVETKKPKQEPKERCVCGHGKIQHIALDPQPREKCQGHLPDRHGGFSVRCACERFVTVADARRQLARKAS